MINRDELEKFTTKEGWPFWIRPNTTDVKAIQEVIERRAYLKRKDLELRPGELVLDIGANIGTFSVMAARAGCRVVAFEPDQDNLELLAINLAENGVQDLVTVRPEAVTYAGGEQTFYMCRSPRNKYRHSTLPTHHDKWEHVQVPGVSFQELLDEYSPQGVKMDVEGAEHPILEALTKEQMSGVRWLSLEFDFDYVPSYDNYRDSVRRLMGIFDHVHYSKALMAREGKHVYFPSGFPLKCWNDSPTSEVEYVSEEQVITPLLGAPIVRVRETS